MGDENVELTTFSPLQDDVYDKNEFHLSYVAKFPLGGRVVVSLDGGVLEMNKPGQLSINTGFIDMPIKAESGLHLLQLTILVPVTEDVDLDSLEPQEDMLLQMIVMFNVVENLPAGQCASIDKAADRSNRQSVLACHYSLTRTLQIQTSATLPWTPSAKVSLHRHGCTIASLRNCRPATHKLWSAFQISHEATHAAPSCKCPSSISSGLQHRHPLASKAWEAAAQ